MPDKPRVLPRTRAWMTGNVTRGDVFWFVVTLWLVERGAVFVGAFLEGLTR